jgi:VanZ family protein
VRALRLWGPVAAWMAVIFVLSSRSVSPSLARFPDWFTHGGGYLILCALACRAMAGGIGVPLAGKDALLAVALSAAYGVADEAHQHFVPGRQATAADVAKDLAGAVVGAWLYRRAFAPRAGLHHQTEAPRG